MKGSSLKFVKKFSVPSHLTLGKRKKRLFSLNLNVYRNTHFQVLNNAKILFKEIVRPSIEEIPQLNRCVIFYEVYPQTRRKFDVGNVCSVVDKFLCDALTEFGVLPDDNYEHLPHVIFSFGSVDKDNPRVDVTIYELKENQMKITVTVEQQDIINLINERAGLSLDGSVELELNAGDGSITVTVDTDAEPAKAAKIAPKVKKAAPKAKAAEPVEEPEPEVEEEAQEEEVEPVEEQEEESTPAKAQNMFSKGSKNVEATDQKKDVKSLFGKK